VVAAAVRFLIKYLLVKQKQGPLTRALLLSALVSSLLTGCQSTLQRFERESVSKGYVSAVLPTVPFPLLSAASMNLNGEDSLRIYIEGDGRSWIGIDRPGSDPTPKNQLVWRLVQADPGPALYLARPCQYVMVEGCDIRLWTSRRYSPEVLQSLNDALDLIKRRDGVQGFELVGYSGGATLALLLAAHRADITGVQTLAGNLSPRMWASLLRVSQLKGSLEPLDFKGALARVPQRHLYGGDDQTVPPALLEAYRRQLPDAACIETVVIQHLGHAEGWEKEWAAWRGRAIECGAHSH